MYISLNYLLHSEAVDGVDGAAAAKGSDVVCNVLGVELGLLHAPRRSEGYLAEEHDAETPLCMCIHIRIRRHIYLYR